MYIASREADSRSPFMKHVVSSSQPTSTVHREPLRFKPQCDKHFRLTFALIFYIHGSVHRESNLIIFQQDATYSVYYISVGSSTCFGC